ncbi:TldD/PmbA family protein [Butyrivibrio sp. DSM 10294]|uniref:TldD/PmbA family protein n=1 Tax=Butyrivibrio sp. DSM 10294 TaxID=2972457 RepID=UPI00234F41F4|nr:TldD/PmbA family protein [Butyrivibrio sp. DSM 10294]MDC7292809.1 TldD/PmbA family protein [Butyrivibrio sp. DSM 10294]
MKAEFSPYLKSIASGLKELIAELSKHFDYVSVLSTDSVGFSMAASQKVKSITGNTLMTERGNVVRVYKNGLYSEYSFNLFDPDKALETASKIRKILDAQISVLDETGSLVYFTKQLKDEPQELFVEMETDSLPETTDLAALMDKLQGFSNEGIALSEEIIDCNVRAQSTHVCKMFLTKNKDLRQSYVYSEGGISMTGVRGEKMDYAHSGVSDREGPHIFDTLGETVKKTFKELNDNLGSKRIEPGEYDIITSPEVSGLIAHEAFGHGVEMDMFVKQRALGASYIDKRVGSDKVTMHEGANCVKDVASYAFDDEGTLAGDVIEIDKGILKTGVCDALAALRLGCEPTGNGKRQNFEHKAYTRMTNTMFDPGEYTKEEMIASVKKGYLLSGMFSGMEDPKHWGIQCIIARGYEIVDGKLTGKVVSPVVLTGYVPDLLGSISMASTDYESFGSGACGKGYKEWVKVSDGGPYLKARARLG